MFLTIVNGTQGSFGIILEQFGEISPRTMDGAGNGTIGFRFFTVLSYIKLHGGNQRTALIDPVVHGNLQMGIFARGLKSVFISLFAVDQELGDLVQAFDILRRHSPFTPLFLQRISPLLLLLNCRGAGNFSARTRHVQLYLTDMGITLEPWGKVPD